MSDQCADSSSDCSPPGWPDPGPVLLLVWSTLLLLVLVLDRMFQGNRKADTWWADPICQVLPVWLSLQGSRSSVCECVTGVSSALCLHEDQLCCGSRGSTWGLPTQNRVFKMFKNLAVTASWSWANHLSSISHQSINQSVIARRHAAVSAWDYNWAQTKWDSSWTFVQCLNLFRPAEKKMFPDGRAGDNMMMIVIDVVFFTSMNL